MTVPADALDTVVDQALERIAELSSRLWDVRRQHQPEHERVPRWRRPGARCAGCGQPFPCATARAADGLKAVAS